MFLNGLIQRKKIEDKSSGEDFLNNVLCCKFVVGDRQYAI